MGRDWGASGAAAGLHPVANLPPRVNGQEVALAPGGAGVLFAQVFLHEGKAAVTSLASPSRQVFLSARQIGGGLAVKIRLPPRLPRPSPLPVGHKGRYRTL
jgi:hypothetical protein